MYAGEHKAGTKFMIGSLFLAAGASLKDLTIGLLIGNILAVLTWRYLVVPDATFGLSGFGFTAIVAIVGVVITLVAAAGYNTVARFANIAAPWMILVFAACGIVSLAQMDAHSFVALNTIWNEGVSFVQTKNGSQEFGLGKIIIFSWLCNAAMHLGMADLSIFRFSKSKSAGWAPAVGMFLGHYMAWICAALLLAALIATNPDASLDAKGKVQADPGFLAWNALGWTGIIVVVIAGWTTANPTIYRAGLAFQSLFKSAPKVTGVLIAGLVATIAGAFPNLSAQLLNFVGTYGMILGPMGAIIFVNHYFAKRLGFYEDAADATNSKFNMAVLLAWLIPTIPGLYMILAKGVFAAYLVIPAWIASAILYVILGKIMFANKSHT